MKGTPKLCVLKIFLGLYHLNIRKVLYLSRESIILSNNNKTVYFLIVSLSFFTLQFKYKLGG